MQIVLPLGKKNPQIKLNRSGDTVFYPPFVCSAPFRESKHHIIVSYGQVFWLLCSFGALPISFFLETVVKNYQKSLFFKKHQSHSGGSATDLHRFPFKCVLSLLRDNPYIFVNQGI